MKDATIAFVLDKSGSMQAIWDDAIGGFNAFRATQVAERGAALFAITLFDSEVHPVHGPIPIEETTDLTRATYVPAGQTALYDAVGATIEVLQSSVGPLGRVLIVVLTDGHENASRAYTRASLSSLITAKKLAGWEFLYLGASPENWDDALALGATPLAYRADGPGVAAAFCAMSDKVTTFRRRRAPTNASSSVAETS